MAALPSTPWVRSKALGPVFRGGMACHHLMGQVSEFVSCLKPQWEDTPGKRPQGPRMGICLPTVFWGPECPVMARYRCGPLWGESSWA